MKAGEVLGNKYEVIKELGRGGLGVVYLALMKSTKEIVALKTYLDDRAKEDFKREALVWVNLGQHQFLVKAFSFDDINGRYYLAMEFVAPDDSGLNSLDGYLKRRPPDLAQTLRWAIQFCYGMEYAYSKGIACHKDIKPANILIAADKSIRISDFGLAGLKGGDIYIGGGTPIYMSPQQNRAEASQRDDIYSFGVVLYECASGKLPFYPPHPDNDSADAQHRWFDEVLRMHNETPVPEIDSALFPVIKKCLEKLPGNRYFSFKELRGDLEILLTAVANETVPPPDIQKVGIQQLIQKASNFLQLGRHTEALFWFNRVLEADSKSVPGLVGKAIILRKMRNYDEAVRMLDMALDIEPQNVRTLTNKAQSLLANKKLDEAARVLKKAIDIESTFPPAWAAKAEFHMAVKEYDSGIGCADKALALDPQNVAALNAKAMCLLELERVEEANAVIGKLFKIDGEFDFDWWKKSQIEEKMGKFVDAIESMRLFCFKVQKLANVPRRALPDDLAKQIETMGDRIIELEKKKSRAKENPSTRMNPTAGGSHVIELVGKGRALFNEGKLDQSISCFDEAIKIDGRNADAQIGKGEALMKKGKSSLASACFDSAVAIDARNAVAWFHKADAEDQSGRKFRAIESYMKFLELADSTKHDTMIAHAKARLQALGAK